MKHLDWHFWASTIMREASGELLVKLSTTSIFLLLVELPAFGFPTTNFFCFLQCLTFKENESSKCAKYIHITHFKLNFLMQLKINQIKMWTHLYWIIFLESWKPLKVQLYFFPKPIYVTIINMKILFKNEKCTKSTFSYIFKFSHVSLSVKSTTIFRHTEPKTSPYTKPVKSIEVSILILVCLL